MIKSRIRVQSSERMATRRSSCDSRPGTVLRELRRRAAEIHNFKRQVRAAGPHFNLQTPSAPMIKPRILRPFFGKAADEAELMRRSAGRSRGNPKPGRAKNFIKLSQRRQALTDPENAPRRPRRKCALLRMSKVPTSHDFRVSETQKKLFLVEGLLLICHRLGCSPLWSPGAR